MYKRISSSTIFGDLLNVPRTKLRVLAGDLALPKFGLGDEIYDNLRRNVTEVYHCAAWVHGLYPYERLRQANVVGTAEILGNCAPKHHPQPHSITSRHSRSCPRVTTTSRREMCFPETRSRNFIRVTHRRNGSPRNSYSMLHVEVFVPPCGDWDVSRVTT